MFDGEPVALHDPFVGNFFSAGKERHAWPTRAIVTTDSESPADYREAFAYLVYRDIYLAGNEFGFDADIDLSHVPAWWHDLAERLQVSAPYRAISVE